jgi:hypothetical protein
MSSESRSSSSISSSAVSFPCGGDLDCVEDESFVWWYGLAAASSGALLNCGGLV